MLTQYLFITVGIPGSGKSTFVKELASAWPNIVVVCPDTIREQWKIEPADRSRDGRVFSHAADLIKNSLAGGQSVIFDATNTVRRTRRRFYDIGKAGRAQVIYLVMGTDHKISLARNEAREKPVPNDVLDRMRDQLVRDPVQGVT